MKKIVRIMPLSILFLIFVNVSCSRSQIPEFDQNLAFEYLRKQCQFGPRNPGSDGHRKCLAYLDEELGKYADSVVKQPFQHTIPQNNKTVTLSNVIASFGSQGDRILLCAHWDTRPWADFDSDPGNRDTPILGANDGASGVAVLLEIARILKANPPPRAWISFSLTERTWGRRGTPIPGVRDPAILLKTRVPNSGPDTEF